MGLPLVRIISAMAPVVLGAFDLYQKRREAKEAHSQPPFGKEDVARTDSGDLAKRMQELEESDVEQARLISELSNAVEALTKSLQREIEDGRRTDARLRQITWIACGLGLLNLVLIVWLMSR
jgi:uncharacterized coiled-coil protein SlyX